MKAHADKAQDHKSKSTISDSSGKQNSGEAAFRFTDSRPQVAAQRKMLEMMHNSVRTKQLMAIKNMAGSSPGARRLSNVQAMGNNSFRSQQATQLKAIATQFVKQKTVQLAGPEEEEKEEEPVQRRFETVQRVASGKTEEKPIQGKFEFGIQSDEAQTSDTIQKQPESPAKNNTGLPDKLKAGVENLSGYSMDDVKVHYNSDKPAQLNAHACAQGTDIHLASGQEKHLPHEAWHVVQQKQGRVKPTRQLKPMVNVNDDAGLEKEADVMGAKAINFGKDIPENKTMLSTSKNLISNPKQLMVAVAGGKDTFNKKDFTQLSHLDWAMKISGGPLVDLDESIASIGVDDDLHLVQHGDKGEMVHQILDTDVWKSIPAKPIASLFIKHLPKNYAGRIRVSSCYSGTVKEISDKDSSLVKEIKSLILKSEREDLHEIWIVGWDGPTITNINLNSDSGTGAETVDDKQVEKAGKLQDQLLDGKYSELKKKWEQNVGKDTRNLDQLAAAAAKEFGTFYQEFADLCKKNHLLLNYVDSLVIG